MRVIDLPDRPRSHHSHWITLLRNLTSWDWKPFPDKKRIVIRTIETRPLPLVGTELLRRSHRASLSGVSGYHHPLVFLVILATLKRCPLGLRDAESVPFPLSSAWSPGLGIQILLGSKLENGFWLWGGWLLVIPYTSSSVPCCLQCFFNLMSSFVTSTGSWQNTNM